MAAASKPDFQKLLAAAQAAETKKGPKPLPKSPSPAKQPTEQKSAPANPPPSALPAAKGLAISAAALVAAKPLSPVATPKENITPTDNIKPKNVPKVPASATPPAPAPVLQTTATIEPPVGPPPSRMSVAAPIPATEDEAEKQARRRINVIKEIVSTETTYVEQLNVIVDIYLNPLTQMSQKNKSNSILADEEIMHVFSNVAQIQDLNNKFLTSLRERIAEAKPDERNALIGQVFIKLGPFFKLYTQYVNNHPKAVEKLVSTLYKRDKFKNFLQNNERTTQSKGLDLESLLITPVQRVPRYKLLLEVLQKSTDPDHPDSNDIKEALKLIGGVADSINTAMKESSNRQEIVEIQRQFGKELNDLVIPTRRFLMKGVLTKKCRSSNKEFTFFLFNDLLLYAHGGGLTQYVLHRKIEINSAFKIQDLPDTATEKNMIEILNYQKSFIVFTPDAHTKTVWLKAMRNCIEEVKARNIKSGQEDEEDTELQPVWEHDKSSKCCTICLEEWSFIKRRHHCRKCGILVCGDCSKGKTKTGKRICDRCVRDQVNSGDINKSKSNLGVTMSSTAMMSSSDLKTSSASGGDGKDEEEDEDMDEMDFVAPPALEENASTTKKSIRFKAIQSYKGNKELQELDVTAGDAIEVQYSNQDDAGNVWWYAQNLRTFKTGWIDPSMVEEEFAEQAAGNDLLGVYKAVSAYPSNAKNEELGFNPGDIIDVLSTHESGYWFGSNRSTGETGWCDPGYLEPAFVL